MTDRSGRTMLAVACDLAQLHGWELWLRYFALGGFATGAQLDRHISGAETLNSHEHDVLVQALNEAFSDMELDHPIAYSRPDPPPAA